ncbi:MAG: tetratricopeptide repeat protein [Candidatus Aureabacteria bacterium]|nr:tetratricopeptide repeat protein [Candidatus Auribacterota bacterium]
MKSLCCLSLIALCAAPLASADQKQPSGAAGGTESVSEPTEFLTRWDRKYRLVDTDVEPSRWEKDRDYSTAAAELKKAIVTGIPDDEMYYRLGFCYEKLGDYDRALEAYLQAVREGSVKREGWPLGSSIFYHLGTVYAKKEMYREAADNFEKAIPHAANEAEVLNNLGYCYRKLSLRRRALDAFTRAVNLDPQLADAFLNMGITYAELGDLGSAEASLRRALDLNPDISGARRSLAMIQHARGVDAVDSSAAHSVIEAEEPVASGEVRLATSQSPLKVEGTPVEGVPSPIEEEDITASELSRARRFIEGKDFAAAGKVLKNLLERNPRCVQACLGMAYISEFAGGERYGKGFPADESIAYYRRAIEIQPGLFSEWFDLGNVYMKDGKYKEAADAFAKAKDLDPSMKYAFYNLGMCDIAIGEKEKAEEQFKEALLLDPDFTEARFQLGVLCSGRRDYGGAIEEFEHVVRLNPADADAHYRLATIYMLHAEKPKKAIEHFTAYLRCKPGADDAETVNGWIRELEEQTAGE